MMLSLTLLALLSAKPAAEKPPSMIETAKLFFLAGDIPKAQDWARACLKREPKVCASINKWLAEYAFLASRIDEFTPEQAREFIELDKKIAPLAQGKMTKEVVERYVTKPFETAKARANGDEKGALGLLEKVLVVDPKHAEALELQKTIRNRFDGGP